MLAFLNEHAVLIYGLAATLALGLAFLGDKPETIFVAAIMLIDWGTWNLTVSSWGFSKAPIFLPIEDAIYGLLLALFYAKTRDPTARLVFFLFALAIIAWVAFVLVGQQATYICYLTANLIFLAQVTVTGAAGVRQSRQNSRDRGRALFPGLDPVGRRRGHLGRTTSKKTPPP